MAGPQSYFERYAAGEREAVWDELIGLGEHVRNGPLFDDALAVARETVRRARHNVELLHGRLLALGYRFADPDAAFAPAGPDAPDRIAEVEQRLGTLPLLARAWYESLASVDFSQAEEQLRGPTGPDVNGLGSHPALILQSLDRGWQAWLDMRVEREQDPQQLAHLADEHPEYYRQLTAPLEPFLPTGGVASNCEPHGFALPCLGADGVLYNDGGGDVYLIHLLRRCFEWGGFPFCRYHAAGNPPLPWEARPNWERVIPLLRDGLLPV